MNINELVLLNEQIEVKNDKLIFSIILNEQQGDLSYNVQLNELEIVTNEGSITEFDITYIIYLFICISLIFLLCFLLS